MATTTKNLKIPLLDGSKPFRTDTFNDAFQAIDENALAKSHAAEKSHWDLWQPNTAYKKQDVFRTTTIPSWGFWEVTKAGTSGTMEPVGYGEDDTFTDGTCELVLRRLTKGGGGSSSSGGSSGTTSEDVAAAKAWAVSTSSPDDAEDADSPTGKTQSSRTWALYAKEEADKAVQATTDVQTAIANALDTLRDELEHKANLLLLSDDGISPFITRFAADDGMTFEIGKVWIGNSVPAGTATWFETEGE